MFETFEGYAPTVKVENLEKKKYEDVWNHPEYRVVAPGEDSTLTFLAQSNAQKGDTVIDFGCGTGRGAQSLKDSGLKVVGVDFASNCLDPQVDIDFVEADLTQRIPVSAKYGYCTDVMEHLPENTVYTVIRNILDSATLVFFQISTVDDVMGVLVGAPLHLTVKPFSWWKEAFENCGAKIIWSADLGEAVQFYVKSPAWQAAEDVEGKGVVNIDEDQVKANIKANLEAGWTLVAPFEKQDVEVILLGGGPSLNEYEDEIRQKREAGAKLFTTNGAYNWCIERGIKPSAQIVVDGRAFNKRFLEPVMDEVKYLVASQCDPEAIAHLPKDRTLLWHSVADEESLKYISEIQGGVVWPVPGGSTVMLRSLMLLQVLGFYQIHVYGMDSCIGETHHAYEQKENDSDGEITVRVKTKTKEFVCAPWMALQAREFRLLAQNLDDEVELAVYGSGLIATMIRESAES